MQQNSHANHSGEEAQIVLSNEQIILELIEKNDVEQLKEWGVRTRDMNFLEPFPEIELDAQISPLILASYLGRYDVVRLLLENSSIDVDFASDDTGQTPLTTACITGNYEIVKMLIDSGAEVNKPTLNNITPLMCCLQRLVEEERNVFENRKICLRMAELLLQAGADINWISDKKKGHTILMQFCAVKIEMTAREMENNIGVIRFLIENGADRNIINHKGRNALALAQKHQNAQAVQEVLLNGKQIYFWNRNELRAATVGQKNGEKAKSSREKPNSLMQYFAICKN